MADVPATGKVTRRTFLGWWMAAILASLTLAGVLPILVYLWPAPPKGQKKGPVNVTLDKPINQLNDGEAIKFNAPTSPNTAFIMADGGGDNAAGDLAFGGFVVKNGSKVDVFAINCSHLGCSVALNDAAKTFDCPCHGSRFDPDGKILNGPAIAPLAPAKKKDTKSQSAHSG